ncbi:MAG TPA: DnaJ domain-containing protein [Bryobacteraceae bacterium]|jgi:curved DNA-binding protein CbpA|nr:DnaJ domain-containing protein [Bryobacteraceae bacterium]
MAEEDKSKFVDYYEMLRVSPGAELESIQRVHRALAARYHPDNKETGNLERFLKVNEAFKVLSDPEKRKEFDATYKSRKENPLPVFLTKEFTEGVDGEINRRVGLLCLLYTQRRVNQILPALSVLEIEQMMFIPREHLLFTIWYLKSKRYIAQDDRSSLMITADGIDFLEANLPEHKTMYKMLEAADMGATRSAQIVTTENGAA